MRSGMIFVVVLSIVYSASASAQQSHLDTRGQIEQLAAVFSERYNKQDAAAIASMFTKDGVRVTSGFSAASVGPRSIEETVETQFKIGFRHIDLVIDQVSSLGTDAAIAFGTFQTTGQGQSGPLKVEGHWTEVEVREGGVWKIRLSTFTPKIDPDTINPLIEANSINPGTDTNLVTSRAEANGVRSNTDSNSVTSRVGAEPATSRLEADPIAPIPENHSVGTKADSTRAGLESESSDVGTPVRGPKKVALLVNIDKSRQALTVSLDGVKKYEWPVSTGKAGYSTPSGTYTATSMNKIWYSKEWDNAPMPHSIFFMKDGHAIHGSLDVKHLGKPVSHGCVRVSPENAATLYALVATNGLENTHVTVSGVTPGGEYKVAKPTLSPVTARRVPGRTQPAEKYYGEPRYSSQRWDYGQAQPQYYPQPAYPGSAGQSGVRYYNQAQGYHFGMRSLGW
jgi:lipoprotein-anchoring transpeptidase ErfK/SrfK